MIDILKLDSKVSVVMEKMDYVRSVSIGFFIKNGSINEAINENGISHFIEHMLFKGTGSRTSNQIAQEMDDIGAQINAFTSKEYTCYYVKALDTHIDKVLDVLIDILFNSKFDSGDIKKESNVILEEINMYEDTPDDLVLSNLQKNVWKNSSLGLSILGSKENVQNFKRDDFINYMGEKYVGENIVISICGNFDKTKFLDKINSKFANMPKGNKNNISNTKKIYYPSRVKVQKDIEQLHLMLAFEGTNNDSDKTYATSILSTILGGGMSSILFQKVREEKGLCYTIYSYNTSYTENGLFKIYTSLTNAQMQNAVDIIIKEIKLLKQNKISKDKIEKAKEQLKSSYIMGLESSFNRMSSMGRSKILKNNIKTPDEIIKCVDNVSKNDIDNLIENIFDFDKISLSLVGRVEKINLDTII